MSSKKKSTDLTRWHKLHKNQFLSHFTLPSPPTTKIFCGFVRAGFAVLSAPICGICSLRQVIGTAALLALCQLNNICSRLDTLDMAGADTVSVAVAAVNKAGEGPCSSPTSPKPK